MFCSKCGVEIPDDSQFCRKCGKALSSSAVSTGPGAAAAPAPAKRKSLIPYIITAVLFVFLCRIAFVAMKANSNHNASTIDQLVKQQRTVTIDKPDTEVNADGYYYWKLQVPAGATSVRLQANFEASGGTGNDVEVYVLPDTDFVNWQNHHAAKAFYNSGKVTVGKFNVTLPDDAGTYYLVLDNRFSLLSKKEVGVKGALTYYQ